MLISFHIINSLLFIYPFSIYRLATNSLHSRVTLNCCFHLLCAGNHAHTPSPATFTPSVGNFSQVTMLCATSQRNVVSIYFKSKNRLTIPTAKTSVLIAHGRKCNISLPKPLMPNPDTNHG